MVECPPTERLGRFLREELRDSESALLVAHVEGCTACQETLHGLAMGGAVPTRPALVAALSDSAPAGANAEAEAFFRGLWQRARVEGRQKPQVDGYDILEEIGRGGVGVVYRAHHRELNRFVAIKMIQAGSHLSPECRERFRREAQAVARLQHPNIIQVYDIGDQAGSPYLALELVQGENLAGWLGGVPRPAAEAARIIATLAGAVELAHRQGVIHRDLKPANILMHLDYRAGAVSEKPTARDLQSATPKIADFGLAKLTPAPGVSDDRMTQSGAIMGTPAYLAPEQARGQTGEIGPAADVYSLGVILYELLTGRPPFQGTTAMETLVQAAHQEPVPPARLVPRIPRDLDTICLKCLEKEPRKRYATAGELADDLERFLKHEPILARPIGWVERGSRWVWLHVGLTAALAGTALSLMLLVIGSLMSAAHFRELEREQRESSLEKGRLADEKEVERGKAVLAQTREAGLRKQAEDQGRELRRNLYFAEMNLAGQAAMTPSGIGLVRKRLAPWEKERADLRDWEWYYLEGLCHRDLSTLRGHVGGAFAARWSKDGRLASAGVDGYVLLWDAESGFEARSLVGHKGAVSSLAWSPDDTRLASASRDGTVTVWHAATGKDLLTFRGHTGEVFSVAWSPDGKHLASGGADQTVRIWGAANGVGVHVLRGHTQPVSGVAWSPDGKQLASAARDYAVRLWDAKNGKEGSVLSGHSNWVNGVAWSPDGTRLASASNDSTVKVWNPVSAREVLTLRGHSQGVSSVAWSPDGRRLLTGSEDQTVKVWPASGGVEPCTLRGHEAAVTSAAWSADGTRLVSASFDGTVKLWEACTAQEPRALRGHTDPVHSLAWHRDGNRLASACTDGTIKIWDSARGKEQTTLRGHKGWLRSVAWSPDGTRLASAGTDKMIRLWYAASNAESKSLRGHTGEVYQVAWSPDGKRLASAGLDHTVRIWDAATGEESQICRGHLGGVFSVNWSPDGTLLASASGDRTVRLWDPTTGRETQVLRIHKGIVKCVAWSPDGQWLASAGSDETIKISAARTGKGTLTLSGHSTWVNAVAWNPEGTRLASAGEDRTVKIWDTATGKETLTLGSNPNQVYALAWSPDGYVLASAGIDQTVLLHDASAGYKAVRSPRYLATLDRRLAADPKNGADWRVRAEIHARLEDWDGATADLRRYLALNRQRRWYTLDCSAVGPYPEDLKAGQPPDKDPNPGQPVRAAGEGGRTAFLNWQSVPLSGQGFVDFGALFGNAEHISAYALLRIYSPEKQQVAILLGSDDQVRLFLNGKQIHEHLLPRKATPDEDAIEATLEPGWNTLLARVTNVTGEHSLYWRLSGTALDLARARRQARP